MSKFFQLSEFQCPCCGENKTSQALIDKLDEIREAYGKPMVVTSGYRCKKHNAEVGGVWPSDHTDGEAADIACTRDGDRFRLIKIGLDKGLKRIGVHRAFVHLSISTVRPQEVIWLY